MSALAGVMCVDASEIALDLISRVWSSSRVPGDTAAAVWKQTHEELRCDEHAASPSVGGVWIYRLVMEGLMCFSVLWMGF